MSAPLDDIVVIDLSRALAGPHAAMMLADMGARVVKVESPGIGDDTRDWGPPFVGPDGRTSTYFLCANRNKESIELDLKSQDGKDVLTALVRHGDVLIENFRPGVLDRLGFSVERLHELNPGLVVLSISGFGHDGPERDRAGYDQIAQGEAGLMSVTGPDPDHPTRIGVPIGDLLAGMYGAYGVATALAERARTGVGRVVRTSLLASVVGVHSFQGTAYLVAGKVGRAQGNHHPSICPYGLFHASDGAVQIAVGSEGLWRKFCAAFDIDPETPGMTRNGERAANRAAVVELVESVFAKYRRDELLPKLVEAGIPAGVVRSIDEVYAWDQTRSQGLVIDVDHAVLGPIQLPGPPLRLDDNLYAGGREKHNAPPTLGQHNASVRAWLAGLGEPVATPAADPAAVEAAPRGTEPSA